MTESSHDPKSTQEKNNPSSRHDFYFLLQKIFAVNLFVVCFLFAWLLVDYDSFRSHPLDLPKEGITYSVVPGTSWREVAKDLAKRHVIKHELYLLWFVFWNLEDHGLKAGEYALSYGLTPSALLHLFTTGQSVRHSLTIIEGWTFKQAFDVIQKHDALDHDLIGVPSAQVMRKIGHPDLSPEGWCYPDTYYFSRGMKESMFIKRCYERMVKILDGEWKNREENILLKSSDQALVLASLVEKETAKAEERPRVAGVFIRRLQQGMLLQSDPSVIYGLGDTFQGSLTYRDLKEDTPYNTYVNYGIPPTPIALPGRASVHAVLHPSRESVLYFVAKGDGSHHFSETLDEHHQAVLLYQRKKK